MLKKLLKKKILKIKEIKHFKQKMKIIKKMEILENYKKIKEKIKIR